MLADFVKQALCFSFPTTTALLLPTFDGWLMPTPFKVTLYTRALPAVIDSCYSFPAPERCPNVLNSKMWVDFPRKWVLQSGAGDVTLIDGYTESLSHFGCYPIDVQALNRKKLVSSQPVDINKCKLIVFTTRTLFFLLRGGQLHNFLLLTFLSE